jgi:hypothetical protein
MKQDFIPPTAVLAELDKKATECERRAKKEPEPQATALREEAKQYRDWIRSIQSGAWTA